MHPACINHKNFPPQEKRIPRSRIQNRLRFPQNPSMQQGASFGSLVKKRLWVRRLRGEAPLEGSWLAKRD